MSSNNLVRDMSSFAYAIEFKISTIQGTHDCVVIREPLLAPPKLNYSMVFSYHYSYFKDEELMQYLLNQEESKLVMLRGSLSSSSYFSSDDIPIIRVVEEPKFMLEVRSDLNLLESIMEVSQKQKNTYWEVEPMNTQMIDAMLHMSINSNLVYFPLSGHYNDSSLVKIDPDNYFISASHIISSIRSIQLIDKGEEPHIYSIKSCVSMCSLDSLKSYPDDWSTGITENNLDNYFRTRHEVVCSTIMSLLGMEPNHSDVSPEMAYDYHGVDCKKTPDFFYERKENNTNYIIDVSVTSMNIQDAQNLKASKYQLLAMELEDHVGKDFIVSPFVMSCENLGDIVMPTFLQEMKDQIFRLQQDIIEINNRIKMLPNYNLAYQAFRAKVDSETMQRRKELMKLFIDAYLSLNSIRDKKATDLMSSYTADPTERDILMNTPEEDDLVNRIKQEVADFDANAAFESFYNEISWRITQGEIPKSIKGVFQHKDPKLLMNKMLLDARRVRNSCRIDVPKVFKFPDLLLIKSGETPHFDESLGSLVTWLADGTAIYDSRLYFKEGHDECRAGIGMNPEEDEAILEDLKEELSQNASEEFIEEMRWMFKDRFVGKLQEVLSRKYCELAYKVSKLARNISLMEGRRMVDGTEKSVFKKFDKEGYALEIAAGSRLTMEKQIRYRLVTYSECVETPSFHSLRLAGYETYYSKWLAVSSTDLKSMLIMFEKVVALACHYCDMWEESTKAPLDKNDPFYRSDMLIMPLIIAMEMKRGTSNTSQYNRYILSSMLGFASDKTKAIQDIMADPVRSRLESYIRLKQMRWACTLSEKASHVMTEGITRMLNTSSDYDRLMCPSIFSGEVFVEFSFLMGDIYLGNLFQKEAGFIGHRSKAIVEKTMLSEANYMGLRNPKTLNADWSVESCFTQNDTKHTFNKDFMMLIGKKLGERLKESGSYLDELVKALSSNVHEAMMMTSSLVESRGMSKTLMNSSRQKTDICFKTLAKLVEEFGTSTLSQMVSRDSVVEAVFSMFPKAQIGGPREILIQSYKLRIHAKFMETLFDGLCKIHPKEMITKGHEKEHIQSSTAMEHKKLLNYNRERRKLYSLPFSLNADASKWSPSFIMAQFTYFLYSLDLPADITDHAESVIKAFSCKVINLPRSLMDKWTKKDVHEKEMSDTLESARVVSSYNNGSLRVFSGMGQGMLHRFSSLLHVAKDDIFDEMIHRHLKSFKVEVKDRSLISSDDLLKQVIFSSSSMTRNFNKLIDYLSFYEATNMLANIHTNWKKTSLSFICAEFNSYFSRGKRASLAVIKDIFTAMEVVDMTEPIMAVRQVTNNLSRAMKNGCFLPCLETMFLLMRKWLIRIYDYKETDIQRLCDLLNCNENQLPADLGFLSTDYILGQCIFGNEILMYRTDNSEELNRFYRNIFTGINEEAMENHSESYIDALSGRIKLCLPYRTDKILQSLIDRHMQQNNLTKDGVYWTQNRLSLINDWAKGSHVNYSSFHDPYFMGTKRNYEHGMSLAVNTVVRALQAGCGKMKTFPRFEDISYTTVFNFVEWVLKRDSNHSSQTIYKPFLNMMLATEKAKLAEASCERAESTRHTRKRIFTFKTREMVLRADMGEILSFIMNSRKKISNRLLKVITDICDILGTTYDDFRDDPVKIIMKTFRFSKWPLLTFRKLMDEYISTRINQKVEIMMSELDCGSAYDNMVMVYCERANPCYNMKPEGRSSLIEFKEYYCSWIASCHDTNSFPINEVMKVISKPENIEVISGNDSLIDRSMKLIMYNHSVFERLSSSFVFHRSFRGRELESCYYFDLENMLVMCIDHEHKQVVYNYMMLEEGLSELVDINRLAHMDRRSSGAEEYMTLFFTENQALSNRPSVTRRKVKWDIKMTHTYSTWRLDINTWWDNYCCSNFKTSVMFKVSEEQYVYYEDKLNELAEMMGDEDYLRQFDDFRHCSFNLEQLQHFMEDNSLHNNEKIGRYEDNRQDMTGVKPLSLEVSSMVAAMSMDDVMTGLLDAFSFDDLDLEGIVEEENDPYDIGGLFSHTLDKEDFRIIMECVSEEPEDLIYSVPSKERFHMTKLIARALNSAMEAEMIIDLKGLKEKEDWSKMRAGAVWNFMASLIHNDFPYLNDWMIRLIIVNIYTKLKRKRDIPMPMNLCIRENIRENPAYSKSTRIAVRRQEDRETFYNDFS